MPKIFQIQRTGNDFFVSADDAPRFFVGRGGRLTWPLVGAALQSANPFDALIAIGSPEWNGRKTTLRKAICARPEFAQRRWRRVSGRFE